MPELRTIDDLAALRAQAVAHRTSVRATITMCGGTGCQASGCLAVVEALKDELARNDLAGDVGLRVTGCHGFCEQGPLAVIEPGNIFYCHLCPDDAAEIVTRTIVGGEIIERLLYTDPVSGRTVRTEAEIPFYSAQDRVLLGQNKLIDPTSIEDSISIGGYSAVAKVLAGLSPQEVIEEVKASGLRGRVPDRTQVGTMPRGRGGREVRHLQRRRRRSRGIHGSQYPRGQPTRGARGDADRRLCRRRPPGLHLCA